MPDSESQATSTVTNAAGRPEFRPFNPEAELSVYVRNLPHWRQPGAMYFVTFRLGDSIPRSVVAEWHDVREGWFRAHNLNPEWKRTHPERFNTTYAAIPAGVRRAFEREQAMMLHEELDRCHGSCHLQYAKPMHQVC